MYRWFMGSDDKKQGDEALLSRLNVIGEQSLDVRAEAYRQLHDELRDRLEGGDERPNG